MSSKLANVEDDPLYNNCSLSVAAASQGKTIGVKGATCPKDLELTGSPGLNMDQIREIQRSDPVDSL